MRILVKYPEDYSPILEYYERIKSGDMVSVGTHAHAGEFAIDFCTAGLSVFELFEDEHTCAFAHDEAISAGAEGAAGTLRVVVARRERVHGVETSYAACRNGCLSATRHHDVGLAEADEVKGGSDGVRARCASRRGGIVWPVETVFDGDFALLIEASNNGSAIMSTSIFSNLVCHEAFCPFGASVVSFPSTIILSLQY